MWIGRNMANDNKPDAVTTGGVNCSADRRLSASSQNGRSQYAIVSPAGIISSPASGADAVVIETSSGQLCLGVVTPYHGFDVSPGEIALWSDGGAVLKLANDGKIYANGREI